VQSIVTQWGDPVAPVKFGDVVSLDRLNLIVQQFMTTVPLPVGQPSFGIIELDPSWSPDGSSIAFTDLSSKIEPRIGVVDVPTGAVAYLPTPRFLSDLSWSAEGIVASMGYPLPSPSIWTGRSDV